MTEPETVRLWLDLEAEGQLPAADAARLDEALLEHPELAREREELAELHRALASSRVTVREGFVDSVMRNLPAAAWEPAGKQRWSAALVAASVLVVLSGLLFSLGGASFGSGVGVLGTLGQFLRATTLAGTGLLGASWRGLGLALEKALESSPATIALFGVGVVALNVLFFRLLRRGRRRPAFARAPGESDSRRPGDGTDA